MGHLVPLGERNRRTAIASRECSPRGQQVGADESIGGLAGTRQRRRVRVRVLRRGGFGYHGTRRGSRKRLHGCSSIEHASVA